MMTKKLKRMQVVVVATVTAAVACVLATPAQAAFVTYDDFNGTVLDSAKWSMPDGTYAPAVGDGNLQLVGMTSTSGWGTGVNSTDHFGYGSFKFAFADYAGGGAHIIALNSRQNDGGPIEAVYLRDDTMATNVGKVVVYKNTAPVASTVLDYAPTALPASYTFVYHPDLLAIYRDIGAGDVQLLLRSREVIGLFQRLRP